MRHALRNLIAFVFLGGIFWFAFQDVENLSNPRFQLTIGGLVVIFALFWIIVPLMVVKMRIIRRNAKNRREYEKWKSGGDENHRVGRQKGSKLKSEPGEIERFHEKGTLYVEPGGDFDRISVPGEIGDVAFPGESRVWRRIQRVHFYLTDRRVVFAGKELDFSKGLDEVEICRVTPGGLVFGIGGGRFCFTFSNPLIIADIMGAAR